MGKKRRLIQAVGISTAIVISNISVAAAKNSQISIDERSIDQVQGTPPYNDGACLDFVNIQSKVLRRTTKEPAWTSSNSETNTPSKKAMSMPNGSYAYGSYANAAPKAIAQTPTDNQSEETQDNTADIIKPPQQPIPSTDPLNPSPNPLSFPTQPEEVQVGTEQPITLEQAIEIALKNNKDIEEARINVERSEAVLREARAALFPTLGLDSGFNYSNSEGLLFDGVVEQQARDANPDATDEEIDQFLEEQDVPSNTFTFSNNLELNYNIYDSGRRGATIRSAEKQLNITELELERFVEEARFEAARDYYDLQNNDALIRIQEAAVEDASQTLRDAQLLKQAGLGTRFDVVSAEVELSQAQQELITARANQNIARRQLAETLSVSHDTDLATADAIEEVGTWQLSLPETIVQAFKNRAELEQFLLQREIGEESRIIELSQARPSVSASAIYSLSDDFEDDTSDFADNYSLGIQAQWQLFDGGAARARAEQAERDSQIAATQFANQRNQIRFLVEQAYFSLDSSRKNIATATKEVELAEESLRLARLRFQAGVGTQTEVIDAQTQLTTARGNLLTSIINYNQSYNQLQREVSNTPDNGLQDLP
ncbi:MAG: TolC family protein [Waterburya sp.]